MLQKHPQSRFLGKENAKPRGEENAQIQTFTHGVGHMHLSLISIPPPARTAGVGYAGSRGART